MLHLFLVIHLVSGTQKSMGNFSNLNWKLLGRILLEEKWQFGPEKPNYRPLPQLPPLGFSGLRPHAFAEDSAWKAGERRVVRLRIFILRETQHTPGAYPRYPQTPKWKEFLHKLLVRGLGYAKPGSVGKVLDSYVHRILISETATLWSEVRWIRYTDCHWLKLTARPWRMVLGR